MEVENTQIIFKCFPCPITSTSSVKHFVQSGEKVSHFRTKIGHPFSPLLRYLLMGILAPSDMYKKWAAAKKEKNSLTDTLENAQCQILRIGFKPCITLGMTILRHTTSGTPSMFLLNTKQVI